MIGESVFRLDEHEQWMRELLKSRKMNDEFYIHDLPIHGRIVWKSEELEVSPIGAGFLRLMEGRYGLLDSFITHANAAPEDRARAIDWIASSLCELARGLGLSKLFAFSLDGDFVKRAQTNLGFQSVPYHFYALNLGDKKCHF